MGSITLRLLLAAGCVAAAQIPIWRIQQAAKLDSELAAKFNTSTLPMQLDAWMGENLDLNDRQLRAIGAVSATQRLYKNEAGQIASVFLASSPASDCLTPHHPTDCYVRAGWKILADDWVTGGEHRYRQMRIVQGDQSAVVLYWYQMGSDAVSNRDELRQVLQQRRQKNQKFQPLVKVLLHVSVNSFPENHGAAGVESLAAEIYTWIKSNAH